MWFSCLNPCCSGRWSRTLREHHVAGFEVDVLILVVVEDGLVPQFEDLLMGAKVVLILVVVEDGLVHTSDVT